MEVWEKWEFSSKAEDLLDKLSLKLNNGKNSEVSSDWLALLKYRSTLSNTSQIEVNDIENNPREKEIYSLIKENLENDIILPDTAFAGLSVNSMNRVLSSVKSFMDEFMFCKFCKCISFWSYETLIELGMISVVLPKLQETMEASATILFSVKELAISKPHQFCKNILIPLLFSSTVPYTDVELLRRVFLVFPTPQRDMLILNYNKKTEFFENDWVLLHPLIKHLSQNSLLNMFDCIQKFSYKFTKSQVFGRFLVSFCKNSDLIDNKDVLRDIIENHQTLLKYQAIKYLKSV